MIQPYQSNGCYDETFEADGRPRREVFANRLQALSPVDLARRQKAAEALLEEMGITFGVNGHKDGTERVWPFDILPRIIDADEWAHIESGLRQRIVALNLFIDDVYNGQMILKDKVVPEELVLSAPTFREACVGHRPPQDVWIHVTGTRPREGSRRSDLCFGRQSAVPFRCVVRAGKPGDDETHSPGGLSRHFGGSH